MSIGSFSFSQSHQIVSNEIGGCIHGGICSNQSSIALQVILLGTAANSSEPGSQIPTNIMRIQIDGEKIDVGGRGNKISYN